MLRNAYALNKSLHLSSLNMQQFFVKFRMDNITLPSRTPWGGHRISKVIKAHLGLNNMHRVIGESWEFSTDSLLPSREEGTNLTLQSILDASPDHWLSRDHLRYWGTQTPLLVKLIDAALDLSLQLHPPLYAASHEPGTSGKWEAWYVVSASPHAGIYIGLERGVELADFEMALRTHINLKPFLNFYEVTPGEMYVIPPGTIHALGAGVCVIEPQVMQPGKHGLTFRIHDWDRRYDAEGNLCDEGTRRPTHVEQALQWIDPHLNEHDTIEASLRLKPHVCYAQNQIECITLTEKPFLHATIVRGTGQCHLKLPHELTSICVVHGETQFCIENNHYTLLGGESGAFAAALSDITLDCKNAEIFITHGCPCDLSLPHVGF